MGCDDELAGAQDLLSRAHLMTLVGPGGAGQTAALEIEVARATWPRLRGGAWLARLAAVTERTILPHAVADALGLSIEGGTATHRPLDVLVAQIAWREMLLVLDNCERLIDGVASLAESILGRCPGVRILATSRERLAIPGEVQLPIAPLAVPAPDNRTGQVTDLASARRSSTGHSRSFRASPWTTKRWRRSA